MTKLRKIIAVPEMGILIPLLGFILLFSCFTPTFFTPRSMIAIMRAIAFVGIIAVGQTWLMVSGEIDLSVGSVAGLCAVVSSWLMKNWGWPVEAGLAVGLAVGALAGLFNGIMAVRVGIPAFIATLGMLYIARGLNYLLCQGYPIYPIPDVLKTFGRAEPLGISWSFIILILTVIISEFCLRKTIWGAQCICHRRQ